MRILPTGKDDRDAAGVRNATGGPGHLHLVSDRRRLRIEELFREHAPRVLDYARHRGATLDEAEDVVSDVFTVLTRRLEDAPQMADEMLPWLLGVARRVLSNQVRGSRRRRALEERSEEAVMMTSRGYRELSETAIDGLIIREALSRLTDKEREALLLVTWDGLKYHEAAQVLGCSEGALAQRVLRGRQLLMEEIRDIRTY